MPPVSEAQRRLSHAAAAHKGGAGGMSQAVGKEFSGADKPGKLPEHKSKSAKLYGKGFSRGGVVPAPKALRTGGSAGYADGGEVTDAAPPPPTKREIEIANALQSNRSAEEDLPVVVRGKNGSVDAAETGRLNLNNMIDKEREDADKKYPTTPKWSARGRAAAAGDGKAKGGKIKHTSGPPIGRDDGLIPAQKGEFVVRKAAVKKIGVAALNEVNKGNLSKAARLYSKKAVHHG